MKRTLRHARTVPDATVDDMETAIDIPSWQECLSEETRSQWNKLYDSNTTIKSQLTTVHKSLLTSWHYQYTIMWLYNVCDSFVTSNYAYTLENGSFKSMWREIKFDELFLLEELSNSNRFATSSDYYIDDFNQDDENEDIEEHDNEPLSVKIRLRLLRSLANNKSLQLKDWDIVVSPHLSLHHSQFDSLPLIDQFEMIYRVIKIIEVKNMTFKNYLSNNLPLFEVPEYPAGEQKTIIALPSVGVLAYKSFSKKDNSETLDIPLKLRNCTITYEDNDTDSKELVHIDYSNEIDSYLQSFTLHFSVFTTDWDSFLTAYSNDPQLLDFEDLIPTYAEHQLYIRRILLQREKEKSMAQLLTRRKRSSRLVAREEESKRKQLENAWYEKLDEREQFLKTRHRLVAKQIKKHKDYIWIQLWSKFEQDLKIIKIAKRNELIPSDPGLGGPHVLSDQSDPLTPLDLEVIQSGSKFTEHVTTTIKPPIHTSQLDQNLEIPKDLLITQEELEELANYGISASQESPDQPFWVFQDPSTTETPSIPLIITCQDEEETLATEMHSPIVCCDNCLTWQPWDSNQTPQLTDLRAADNTANPKDYAMVQLSVHGSRRSVRTHNNQPSETHYIRPTDRRKPIGESRVFVCVWCLAEEEAKLRDVFVAELKNIRLQDKRRSEERERKMRLKEEKRQQVLAQQVMAQQAILSQPMLSQTDAHDQRLVQNVNHYHMHDHNLPQMHNNNKELSSYVTTNATQTAIKNSPNISHETNTNGPSTRLSPVSQTAEMSSMSSMSPEFSDIVSNDIHD